MFTDQDLQQFKDKGISLEKVKEQIDNFKRGFPYINLSAAATKEHGLKALSEEEINEYLDSYNETMADKKSVKFVPASGAASRMFKHLFEFQEQYQPNEEGLNLFNSDTGFNSVYHFITNLDQLAFYDDLREVMRENGVELEEELMKKNYHIILDYLLNDKGLGYAKLPKGLLKFHHYDDTNRFAIEEHLVEAAVYGKNADGNAYLHFTVSPEHQEKFEETIAAVKSKYEDKYEVKFQISFSQQKPSTDTIAVTPENEAFREDDGSILFRPGGHGALIENLNDIDADIIFIKNIDNIVPDRLKEDTFKFKKLIGSYLADIQEDVFNFLTILEEGNPEEDELEEMFVFLQKDLSIEVPEYIKSMEQMEQIDWLFEQFNKPIRVCGMVKNEGEPGGGPFIVESDEGEKSLQIVESSQIDFSKEDQAEIVKNATHFNPVDLVCAVKNFKGEKFDLKEFVDENTGFISSKSKNGKELKAQELPGLWNGAMAKWITVFMEVPIVTFNPVKTVNDLLRDQHQ
jgi:hypothetical protein